jgi:hypothetical protein
MIARDPFFRSFQALDRILRAGAAGVVLLGGFASTACSSASNAGAPGDGGANDDDGSRAASDSGASSDASSDGAAPHDGGATDSAVDGGGEGVDAGPSLSSQLTDGTRLVGKWRVTADGLSQLESLHDKALDIDCAWATAGDGMLRCLPTSIDFTLPNDAMYYADSSCTQPIYGTGACAPTRAYVALVTPTCPSGLRIFSIGAALSTPPTSLWYGNGTSTCTAGAEVSDPAHYALTEIPPSTFVGGAESPGPSSAGLAAAFVVGGDGSRSFHKLRDTANGQVACSFETATDSMLRCLPSDPVLANGDYADPQCTVPVAQTSATSCPSVAFAGIATSGCPAATTIFRGGAAVQTEYNASNGQCNVELAVGPSWFAQGPTVAPSSFVAGTRAYAAGSSRLVPRVVHAGTLVVDDEITNIAVLRDTQRNEECIPRMAADMVTRCVPYPVDDVASAAATAAGIFSDAACTVAAAITQTVGCSMPKYAFAIDQSCGQGNKTSVFPVTGPASALYVMQGATCASMALPTGYQVFAIGAEIVPTSFQQLDEKIQ